MRRLVRGKFIRQVTGDDKSKVDVGKIGNKKIFRIFDEWHPSGFAGAASLDVTVGRLGSFFNELESRSTVKPELHTLWSRNQLDGQPIRTTYILARFSQSGKRPSNKAPLGDVPRVIGLVKLPPPVGHINDHYQKHILKWWNILTNFYGIKTELKFQLFHTKERATLKMCTLFVCPLNLHCFFEH